MTKIWFKAKRYGYGWYPASREGWLVLLVYLLLVTAPCGFLFPATPAYSADPVFTASFITYVAIITAGLLWICVRKGEPARWRWGGK